MPHVLSLGRNWVALLLLSSGVLLPAAALAQDAVADGSGDAAGTTAAKTGIDWSVGLRGSYASDSLTGTTITYAITPEASFTMAGPSSTTVWSAGAEGLVEAPGGEGLTRLSDFHSGVSHSFAAGPGTNLAGSAALSVTQASPTSSGLPATTLIAPVVVTGTLDGSVAQKLGQFTVTPSLRGERLLEGDTTLTDHSIVTNHDQSYQLGKAGLRVAYEFTPLVNVFLDGSLTDKQYDAVDPTLLKFLNNRTYQLRAGVSYTQTSILATEASLGRAFLDYTDASLTDAPSWVADGTLTFTPDETLTLKASLETILGPSSSVSGDTDASYTLAGSAAYLVNPWLALRSSGALTRTVTIGTGDIGQSYTLGAGVDYASSRHLSWSADYLFKHTDPATGTSSDTHTVTLGAKMKR